MAELAAEWVDIVFILGTRAFRFAVLRSVLFGCGSVAVDRLHSGGWASQRPGRGNPPKVQTRVSWCLEMVHNG